MAGLERVTYLGVLGAMLVTACGGSEPEPQTQFQGGGQFPPQQQPQQPMQPAPGQPAPGQPLPAAQPAPAQPGPVQPAPAIPGVPNAPASNPAQQLDPSMGAAAQPLLNQLATTDAPGAKPLGSSVVGMFQPGQQLETVVTMQPGKCYAVIAVGMIPVSEVNIQLVAATPIPGLSPVLAQDQTAGPQAVLGKAPNCYRWALPVPGSVKVITTVAAGQGVAAVQVYEK